MEIYLNLRRIPITDTKSKILIWIAQTIYQYQWSKSKLTLCLWLLTNSTYIWFGWIHKKIISVINIYFQFVIYPKFKQFPEFSIHNNPPQQRQVFHPQHIPLRQDWCLLYLFQPQEHLCFCYMQLHLLLQASPENIEEIK